MNSEATICTMMSVYNSDEATHSAYDALPVAVGEIVFSMLGQLVSFGLRSVRRLLKCIEHEISPHRATDVPANDASGQDVDDEGDIDEILPGRDVREVGDPQLTRPLRLELAIGPGAFASATVVRTTLPRMTQRRPHLRINCSTVQRATSLLLRATGA